MVLKASGVRRITQAKIQQERLARAPRQASKAIRIDEGIVAGGHSGNPDDRIKPEAPREEAEERLASKSGSILRKPCDMLKPMTC